MNKEIYLNIDCCNREDFSINEGDSLHLTILPLLNRNPFDLANASIRAIYSSDTGYYLEQTDGIIVNDKKISINVPNNVISTQCILKFCLEFIENGEKTTSEPFKIKVREDIRSGKVPFPETI